MNWRKLLLPFSLVWWIITGTRNTMYSAGILPSKKFNKPIIVIGNLSVGGTGKSPHVMHVLDILRNFYSVASLSRGYGRRTKGFRVANYDSTASEMGDEPMQFFNRFKNRIIVAVGEDRVQSIKELFKLFRLDAVVLDDAFQHRKLKSDMNIVLTDYSHRYTKDYLLPAGNLRESRRNAKRAQIIIVTKCPNDLSEEEKKEIRKELKPTTKQHIFFSRVKYANQLEHREFPISLEKSSHLNVLSITGIASPQPFIDYLKANFNQVRELNFPDHYVFKEDDVRDIVTAFNQIEGEKIILTTEKDYMRLRHEYSIVDNLYYLPISIEIDKEEEFNHLIFSYVQSFRSGN